MRIFAGIIMKLHNGAKVCICNFMQQQIQWAFLMKSCFKFKFYYFSPLSYNYMFLPNIEGKIPLTYLHPKRQQFDFWKYLRL